MKTSFISFVAEGENGVAAVDAQTSGANQNQTTEIAQPADGKQSGEQQSAGGGWGSLIMIAVMIAVFYFLLIRPQQKKQKEMRKFREALKEGDNVVTAGGIYGKITSVRDTVFIIKVGEGVTIKVDKGSVYPSAADSQEANPQQK